MQHYKSPNLIKDVRWDGSIDLCYAWYYVKRVFSHTDIEDGRYNIFGGKLDPIKRDIYVDKKYLIGGEGIRSFRNETDLKIFLQKMDFKGIMYSSDQTHKEVADEN